MRYEVERFFRHALVPFVTWLVSTGRVDGSTEWAVTEALAILAAFVVTWVWSKARGGGNHE